MYGGDGGRGRAVLRLADGAAGGPQDGRGDRSERRSRALESGERGVQPSEEQWLEPGACLQYRPGEVEVVLPAFADRLHLGAVAGTGQSAASAGRGGGPPGVEAIWQPQERGPAAARQPAGLRLGGGMGQSETSGETTHRPWQV